MIGYSDTHWEGNRLFLGKKDTTIKLVQDKDYSHMYWLEWDFDEPRRSINCYNISNAKDNARVLYLRYTNNSTE